MTSSRLLCGLLAVSLSGCLAPTILKIDTDPQGADVESAQLGYLGTTPIEKTFSGADMQKVGVAGTVSVDLKLSKRNYVSIDLRQVSFAEGTIFPLKKTLEPRLELVEIETEPAGASVFQLILDKEAPPAVATLFTNDPLKASEDHPRWVTQRFIGPAPTTYKYDSEHPLEHNDPLLFLMAGYHPVVAYFKANQGKLRQVMRPLVIEAR